MLKRLLFLFLLLTLTTAAEQRAPADEWPGRELQHKSPEPALEQIKQRIESLTSYRVELEAVTAMDPAPDREGLLSQPTAMVVRSKVVGRKPDRLRIEMSSEQRGDQYKWLSVYDGTWQWTESERTRQGQLQERKIVKLALEPTTAPERPFDTFYYLSGSGLFRGLDYPDTLLTLLRLYPFEVTGQTTQRGQPCYQLSAPVNKDALDAYAAGMTGSAGVTRQLLLRELAFARLYVTGDLRVLGYELGPDEKNVGFSLQVLDYQPEPELGPQTFNYTPPTGYAVSDITSVVLQQLLRSTPEPSRRLIQAAQKYVPKSLPEELEQALEAGQDVQVLSQLEKNPELLQAVNLAGETPLQLAVEARNLKLAQALLKMGAKTEPPRGNPPLMRATDNDQMEMIELLLKAQADPNVRNEVGESPLHLVRSVQAARTLLQAGADYNLFNYRGKAPVETIDNPEIKAVFYEFKDHRAAAPAMQAALEQGDTAAVLKLLDDKVPVDVKLDYDYQPVHLAAYGPPELLRTLLQQGADPNARGHQGRTPLHLAATPENVHILMQAGADPKLATHEGLTPLHTTLDLATARALVKAGVDPRATSKDGSTALHLSLLEHGRPPELIEGLMQICDIDQNSYTGEDFNGATALHLAISDEQAETWLEPLLEAEADPNQKTRDGWTSLHLAVIEGKGEIVEQLLQHQARPAEAGDQGWTALHCAAFFGRDAIIGQLLQAEAAINPRDQQGNTPLHLAAYAGRASTVNLLLKCGADKNLSNSDGETPAQVARAAAVEVLK